MGSPDRTTGCSERVTGAVVNTAGAGDNMTNRSLVFTYLIAMSIITWGEIKTEQRVPKPQAYVAATVVWVLLGIVAEFGAAPVATVVGFGYILAMLYSRYNKAVKQTTPGDESRGNVVTGSPPPPYQTS